MMLYNVKRFCGRQIGKYSIIRYIGEGRYGVCFLAETSGKKVILKKFKPRVFKRNKEKNNYETEILSRISHQGIPKLLTIIDEKGFYGLVLEKKEGETLETLLFKKRHIFNSQEILKIGKQLIAIIQYLHEKGIAHRDMRIPNVLVDGDTVSLLDFGLARWVDNKRYIKDTDFSYFGDLLLFLLYSSYKKTERKSRPWYEELILTLEQMLFLKRLLRLEKPFQDINEIAYEFQMVFRTD